MAVDNVSSSLACRSTSASARHDHVVQFYEDDLVLVNAVADYLGAGMAAGQSVVVVATPGHRDAIANGLEAKGFDVDGACFRGRMLLLDAEDTLSTFMEDGLPDPELFRATVGRAIETRLRASGSAGLRAFGEMVDVLWRMGNAKAALELESLWNALSEQRAFSLLCAYSMGGFFQESHAAMLEDVCRRHSRVLPAESYLRIQSEDERLREVVRLQQQARALQTEVEERARLETALRAALAAQKQAEFERRDAQADLRDFVENAVEGLHWVNEDGTILWANQAEADLVGCLLEELIGRNIREFHADQAALESLMARLSRNERVIAHRATLRCKDGSTRRVEINSNVLWRDGRFVHTRCFTREVLDR